ncbi:extracellular solute-binding protein [Clostridiaceae bacterium OM02-2AC]|nr:extracellular solute-binding protein [Clostridiaceae bacterium OM02-2AC]
MKKIFISLVLLATLLVFDVTKENSDSIIIYSSMEQYRGEELQKQLDRKFPNEKIMVMYVPTAKAAAKIKVEKQGTDADIVVGLETSYLEKVKDSLADLHGIKELPYVKSLTLKDNDYKYVTWERQAGAFIVNKDVLKKYNLPTPKSYSDLLKPEYKGLIAMPDPKTSGTGYFFYKSLINELGDEKALKYIDDLSKNIKSFTESGSGPIKLLIQGEVGIGLGLTFQAMEQINEGSPFKIIYPKEGSPYSLTGTGIIKGREENEKIKKVFDFIVDDFFIYDKEYFSPEQVLQKQDNKIKNYPKNIHYANMEGISDIDEKERLLKLWKY